MIHWVISTLEGQSPLCRLRIAKAHLDFDRGSDSRLARHRIPRSAFRVFGRSGQRDLRSAYDRRSGRNKDPSELLDLGGIPQRISARVQPNDDIKTERGRNGHELIDRRAGPAPGLDPREGGARDASGAPDHRLRQTDFLALLTELVTEPLAEPLSSPLRSVPRSLVSRHPGKMHRTGSSGLIAGDGSMCCK